MTFHVMSQKQEEILTKFLKHTEHFIMTMPFGQGVLVMTSIGIVIGTLSQGNLNVLADIVRYFSIFVVLLFGSATLFVLSHDRRSPRLYIQISVVLFMIMNLSYLIPFNPAIFTIIHSTALVVISITLFLMSVRCSFYPTCHPLGGKRSQDACKQFRRKEDGKR